MQILPSQDTLMTARMENHATFYHTEETISAQQSNHGDTVILSHSNSSLYMESIYTAEGILLNSDLPSSHNIIALGASPENEAPEAIMVENALNQYYEIIRKWVEHLFRELSQQASAKTSRHNTPLFSNGKSSPAYMYTSYSLSMVEVSQTTIIEGSNLDSSYFSAENTAERIIQFALSFYTGGDRQEYAAMVRKAVMKGYYEARHALGGFLPSISQETIALVNRAIDDFAAGTDINISA